MKHVTIQEVAEQAGVSIQTVSRVINHRPDVSPETRLKIQAIIDRLDYQPFAIARGLASKHTYTLGLVTVDFSNYWFSQVTTGAEQEAHEHGYFFMLFYQISYAIFSFNTIWRKSGEGNPARILSIGIIR